MRSGDTVEAVSCEVYVVPTDQPEADGTLSWSSTTMVVVHARGGGCKGLGWTYAGPGTKEVVDGVLADVVAGCDVLGVPGVNEAMRRACRNLGRPGLASEAISAVDIALWDLKANVLGLPLSDLFGRAVDEVPVYGSGGFTTYSDAATVRQVEGWVGDQGIPRVKIKIGESWGREVRRDLERVELVRRVVGDHVELMVDANGAYQPKQAVRVGRQLSERGVTWYEEPVSSDDLPGLRAVRRACDIDVAAGEYGYSPDYFATMVTAGAVDCVQADATRCGGYTAWLKAAAVAESHHLQISAHCAPNLHARVATSAVNLRHIEYFHDHARLEELLFEGTLSPEGGTMRPDAGPGHGLELRVSDAVQFRAA